MFDGKISRALVLTSMLIVAAHAAQAVDVTPFNNGIAITDDRGGPAYVMYSAESVFTRFSPAPHLDNADHLIAVVYDHNDDQWFYDNNSSLYPFDPAAGDRLLASLDLTNDTATVLLGSNEVYRGISRGVASTDLTFVPNLWGGKSNMGEFSPEGSFFLPFDEPANVVPTAGFTFSMSGDVTPLSASFDGALSADDSSITDYAWDFGDGNAGTGLNATHDYSSAGVYQVALTVTDDAGASDTIVKDVFVAAGSLVSIGDTHNGVAATDGAVGTGFIMYSEQAVHDRFYPAPHLDNAAHLVAVVYDNEAGTWLIDNNSTRRPFTSVASDVLIAAVNFTDDTVTSLVGSNETYRGIRRGYLNGDLGFAPNLWGGKSNAGEFQVTGTSFSLSSDVPNTVPVATMLLSPDRGPVPLAVTCDASASSDDGSIAAYAWDFGDGTTGVGSVVNHTFAAEGAYVVTVTVTDDLGLTDSTTSSVTVVPDDGAVDIGELANGVAATDSRIGTGFLMYSAESVHTRFASAPHPFNADNVIAVVYDAGSSTWKYDNNQALHGFALEPTDVLIAAVDFGADTVVSLQGQQGDEHGIARGYEDGDLAFTPNIWGGATNLGEFNIVGTHFVPWSVDPNTAPVASDGSVDVAYEGSAAVTLEASDADEDGLTYQIIDGPTKGSLSGTAPALTYTAQAGQAGADFFTFRVNDGYEDSNLATVTLAILDPPNTPPTVDDQALSVETGASLAIMLTGADGDADPLTFSVTSGPTDGVLAGTAPSLTYTPNGGFTGTDTIAFVANDGTDDSLPGTITITVTTPAVAPVAVLDRYVTAQAGGAIAADAATGVLANDQGVDAAAQAELVTDVTSGTLSLAADGSFSYQAPVDWRGTEQFTYRLSTSQGVSSAVTVYLSIGVVPTATVSALTMPADNDFDFEAWEADSNGVAATYAASVSAGRIWDRHEPGPAVPIIQADIGRYQVVTVGTAVPLTVLVPNTANAPVNFHATGKGLFNNSGTAMNAITAVADGNGRVAGVTFTPPAVGRHVVLAASPVASGFIRFVVEAQ